MRYFFVKIGSGNVHAVPLLDEQRLGHPAVAGFFRSVPLLEVIERQDDPSVRFSRQVIDLYRWSVGDPDVAGYGICVAAGFVWVLEPAGPMYEIERDAFEERVGPVTHADDLPKIVPVRILTRERITHVPTLVVHLTSNRHLSSSTFKEITDDFGTIVAIEHVLFKAGIQRSYPTITGETRTLYHLLQCLGGNELINLVVQILEDRGVRVPAPTGGFVRNIDLIAYNDTPRAIAIDGLTVPPRRNFRSGAITIQVRGALRETQPTREAEVDYVIQINAEPAPQILNFRWFESTLSVGGEARERFARLVRWVPFAGQVIRSLTE
ncbi:MAG: hypothetical protein ACLFR8_05805 [Alkalispirochaeta sp.]